MTTSILFKMRSHVFAEIADISLQMEEMIDESGKGFISHLASINCWQVMGIDDLTLALFYLTFSEKITVVSYRH